MSQHALGGASAHGIEKTAVACSRHGNQVHFLLLRCFEDGFDYVALPCGDRYNNAVGDLWWPVFARVTPSSPRSVAKTLKFSDLSINSIDCAMALSSSINKTRMLVRFLATECHAAAASRESISRKGAD